MTRTCLLVVASAVAPTASVQAGYVSSDLVFAQTVGARSTDTVSPFGLLSERPALVVAGTSQAVQDQGPDAGDQSVPRAVNDRLSASILCQGSGRTRPAPPVTRKLTSSSDVVLYADSSAHPGRATKLATYRNRVVVYHPCSDRLFRPPRPVGC